MSYIFRERTSDLISDLLSYRGITREDDKQASLSPDYDKHTHDPFLMKDMEKTIERVLRAVKNGEKILIFSDYDADGIPGGVVLHDFFKKIGYSNFENYIPHRHNEGFGLGTRIFDECKEKNITLVITIDCGISNITEVLYAHSLGIDVIITDHHLPHEEKPAAYAILNPKQEGCTYPEKMLCGSGVIFKFVQGFLLRHGSSFNVPNGYEKWFLDLVGIATLSDMVPLVGENRVFAVYGLKVLKKTKRPGLLHLYSELRLKKEHLSEDDIGFSITPRINAASRMGEADQAFHLLATEDETQAREYARHLEHVNNERKGTVAALVKEIRKHLGERDMENKEAIVMGNPHWRPSLLGLVANTLSEELGKPVFLWGRDGDDVIKGSCRSKGSHSVINIMNGVKDMFIEYGGHTASGGFAVKAEHIHELEEKLCESARNLSVTQEETQSFVDLILSPEDLTWDTYNTINILAPFGTGNPKPVCAIQRACIYDIKSFGKTKNHTEVLFYSKQNPARIISGFKFFAEPDSFGDHTQKGNEVVLIGHIEKSMFKRYPELRFRILDIIPV